jgi:hypothetical protein
MSHPTFVGLPVALLSLTHLDISQTLEFFSLEEHFLVAVLQSAQGAATINLTFFVTKNE